MPFGRDVVVIVGGVLGVLPVIVPLPIIVAVGELLIVPLLVIMAALSIILLLLIIPLLVSPFVLVKRKSSPLLTIVPSLIIRMPVLCAIKDTLLFIVSVLPLCIMRVVLLFNSRIEVIVISPVIVTVPPDGGTAPRALRKSCSVVMLRGAISMWSVLLAKAVIANIADSIADSRILAWCVFS